METTYFVLGMLSIIGAGIIATIVWGVVKITKLLRAIKQYEEWISNNDRNMHENIRHLHQDLDRRMENMERYGHERVSDLQREMELKTNSQITDAVTQSTSYTDKRIDKLIDTYFDTVGAKKQVLKG